MNAALPRSVWLLAVLLTLIAVVCGGNPHPHTWWDAVPANGAIAGYVGAYGLVFAAKSVLAPLLRRHDEGGSED